MAKKSRQHEGIPADIANQILLLLSVRTLSRFKYVCKSWFSLITSPLFQKDHYLQSQNHPLLLMVQNTRETDKEIHMSTYNTNETLVNNFSIRVARPVFQDTVLVYPSSLELQSCLGLVCIRDVNHRRPILICNPSIEEIIALPYSKGLYPCVGFGCLASTQEFKVARFFRDKFHEDDYFRGEMRCEVFTIGNSDCWRESRRLSYPICSGRLPFLHGALHLYPYYPTNESFIAAFNIESEEYTKIKFPERYYNLVDTNMTDYGSMYLTELGGSLCLTIDHQKNRGWVELWLLKDYNNVEWAKEYDIDLTSQVRLLSSWYHISAHEVAVMKNGRIYLNFFSETRTGTELLCYDPENKTITQRLEKDNCSAVFYVERLLPLVSE